MDTYLTINKDKGGKLYVKYTTQSLRDKPNSFRVISTICDSKFLPIESPAINNAYNTTELEIHKKLRNLPNVVVDRGKSTLIK